MTYPSSLDPAFNYLKRKTIIKNAISSEKEITQSNVNYKYLNHLVSEQKQRFADIIQNRCS